MTKVRFTFVDVQGNPLAGMDFKVMLRRASFDSDSDDLGISLPEGLTFTTDINGQAIVELRPLDAPYRVAIPEEFQEICCKMNWSFYVPVSDGIVDVQDLVMVPPPSSQPWDDAAMGKITQAVVDSKTNADSAAASAIEAAETAQSIEGDATDAREAAVVALAAADTATSGASTATQEANRATLEADRAQAATDGKQDASPKLSAIAASVWAANRLMYMTGAGTVGFTDFPAQARTFLAASTELLQRTALGLGTVSTLNANAFVQTFLNAASQAAQRTALGLGTASVLNANAFAQTFLNAASVAQQRAALVLGDVATDNVVPIARGGTGATTQAGAQTALGLVKSVSAVNVNTGEVWTQTPANGMFGLGGAPIPRQTVLDIESQRATEFFYNSTGAHPFPGIGAYVGQHITYAASNYAFQLAAGVSANSIDRVFGRVLANGSWRPVLEFWHDKNLNLSNLPDLTINGGLNPLSINTSQPSGLTLTRLNATGNNSIKFVTTGAGGYERHLGFAVGGVLKVNSGPDLTDVNAETVWTSASLPKQTSVTDTTVNSVLTTLGNIGPFGLGGYPVQRRTLAQMNLDKGNEFFDNNLSTADNPFGAPGCGIHVTYPATARWAQLFFKTVGVSGVSIQARTALGGAPVAPVELWHTGNLTPNKLGSYTLATLPNAAANVCLMAWCSNLTGGPRVVVSDGVNWRRVFDNSIAN